MFFSARRLEAVNKTVSGSQAAKAAVQAEAHLRVATGLVRKRRSKLRPLPTRTPLRCSWHWQRSMRNPVRLTRPWSAISAC